jgi:hypothetical protein
MSQSNIEQSICRLVSWRFLRGISKLCNELSDSVKLGSPTLLDSLLSVLFVSILGRFLVCLLVASLFGLPLSEMFKVSIRAGNSSSDSSSFPFLKLDCTRISLPNVTSAGLVTISLYFSLEMFRVRCIVSTISVSYITAFPGSIHFLTSSLLSPYVNCLSSYSNLLPLTVCSSSSPGLYYVGTFGVWMGFIPLILIGRVGVNSTSGFYFSMRGFTGRDYSLLLGFSAVFI